VIKLDLTLKERKPEEYRGRVRTYCLSYSRQVSIHYARQSYVSFPHGSFCHLIRNDNDMNINKILSIYVHVVTVQMKEISYNFL
jgi:hypothetical protein